jgi:sirohydrochlorin ferrochelatase
MASRGSIQAAIDRLGARGVTQIVAVPLFVSSYSSVITSTEYLLGLRQEAPADLKIFARMDHSSHGTAGGNDHTSHGATADATTPVTTSLPVQMTTALNRHLLVGQIAADRAKSISTQPENEAVVLIAHGPVPEDDNQRWLADMAVIAEQVRGAAPFASVDYMTVRDDAGAQLRAAATADIRSRVERHLAAGRKVLVVPHVLSFGGIENGLRKRIEGLDYQMAGQGLMPDPRIAQWVLAQVRRALTE